MFCAFSNVLPRSKFIWTCTLGLQKRLEPLSHRFSSSNPKQSKSYYDVLEVSKGASQKEIKNAFLNLSKKYHPDIAGKCPNAHEMYVKIVEAYSVLSKPESRKRYDDSLAQPVNDYSFDHSGKHSKPYGGQYPFVTHWHSSHFTYESQRPLSDDELRKRRYVISAFFMIALFITLFNGYKQTMWQLKMSRMKRQSIEATDEAERFNRELSLEENMKRIFPDHTEENAEPKTG